MYDMFSLPFFFGGTSLLILVGVALNLIDKVNAYRYENLMRAAAAAKPRRQRVQYK